MTFDAFDVVVVPFPFTDRRAAKNRPALVLSKRESFGGKIQHSVLAMITSQGNAPWPLDVPIRDESSAGLTAPSMVRMKLFTLDHRLILRKAGRMAQNDQQSVLMSLNRLFVASNK